MIVVRCDRGSAVDFHARPLPDRIDTPEIWAFEVDRPALVLGSTQRDDIVDMARAADDGVEVVRRRSGGGAVWLAPGEVLWVDVLVGAGHRLWREDVGQAAEVIGDRWQHALGDPTFAVHRGAMVRTPWSALVCWAGRGPGELIDRSGAKVVGISQRRTRGIARFQCALMRRFDPGPYERYLIARPPASALAGVGAAVAAEPDDLVDRLAAALAA
jgi:lipoate---protein ligase